MLATSLSFYKIKRLIILLILVLFFGNNCFSQKAKYLGNTRFNSTPTHMGYPIMPRWDGGSYEKTHTNFVTYKNLNKWLRKYNKILKKSGSKRWDYVIYEEATVWLKPNTWDAFVFDVNFIKPESNIYYIYLALPEELESIYYNKAMYKLSPDHYFDSIIKECKAYLKKFPNGNNNFKTNILNRITQIESIPEDVKKKMFADVISEVEQQKAALRQQRIERIGTWISVFATLLSGSDSSNSNNNYESKQCSKCFGSGRIKVYSSLNNMDMHFENCDKCGGTGKN